MQKLIWGVQKNGIGSASCRLSRELTGDGDQNTFTQANRKWKENGVLLESIGRKTRGGLLAENVEA